VRVVYKVEVCKGCVRVCVLCGVHILYVVCVCQYVW
jgi:hypothetical protein